MHLWTTFLLIQTNQLSKDISDDDEISSNPPHSNEPTIQESHHLSNSCDNTQPLHNSFTYINSTPPHSKEPNIQETPDGDKVSSTPPDLNEPTIQESPDGDEISTTPPYSNKLPIQETPDGDEISTSSEGNSSP
jgi:hypothetical protein